MLFLKLWSVVAYVKERWLVIQNKDRLIWIRAFQDGWVRIQSWNLRESAAVRGFKHLPLVRFDKIKLLIWYKQKINLNQRTGLSVGAEGQIAVIFMALYSFTQQIYPECSVNLWRSHCAIALCQTWTQTWRRYCKPCWNRCGHFTTCLQREYAGTLGQCQGYTVPHHTLILNYVNLPNCAESTWPPSG